MNNFSYILFRALSVLGILVIMQCRHEPFPEKPKPAPQAGQHEWQLNGFAKQDSVNPILQPDMESSFLCPLSGSVRWEARNVLNPTAILKDNKVYLFYRAQDPKGTSRIGLAVSSDGINFIRKPEPVLFPEDDHMRTYEWNYRKAPGFLEEENCADCYFDGVEDPRIVEGSSGTYYMTYTAYDGKTARLSIASSKDLHNWTKHGLVLKNEKYANTWSKSGSIIAHLVEGRMVAAQINGKYWMYYGDTDLFMAMSDDLVNWTACENSEHGKRISVMHPRPGYFDSSLVEPGPNALLTEQGVLLIYNARNAANFNDPGLPEFTYAAGQALFDAAQPFRLIDRTHSYFLHPEKDYERVGEVNEVCFVEGWVYFQEKWFLYYGTGDSKIAVAVRKENSGTG